MFERFTEPARRAIFFARFEASVFGSPYIESEHLLLGLLRDDPVIRTNLPVEAIRKQVERLIRRGKPLSTSVDLPLSSEAKRVIAYCAEIAEIFHHPHIDCIHLLFGLTRVEQSLAARVLGDHGFTMKQADDLVRTSPPAVPLPPLKGKATLTATIVRKSEPPEPIAASLDAVVEKFQSLIQRAGVELDQFPEVDAAKTLPSEWTRQQELGHLIDWTFAHHQWFARALTEPRLVAAEYPDREFSKAMHYEAVPWVDLIQTWISVNRLMAHLLAQIPEEKLDTPCQIGVRDPIPLWKLVTQYVEHCEDTLGQLLGSG
jgi:hypothetical protein